LGGFNLTLSIQRAAKESHKFEPFLKCETLLQDAWIRKLLMTTKVRIRAWQEEGDSANNMADRLGCQGRLGHQKLTKEFQAGSSVSMKKDHWHHQE
jgi:hypothetical protein